MEQMGQNSIIMFLIGGVIFVLMPLIKIPIKKCTRDLAERWATDDEDQIKIYHWLNLILVAFTVLIALFLYCIVLLWLREAHFKFCCSLKGIAIAMAFYMLLEQWM